MNEVNPWAQRIILPQAVSFLPIIDEVQLSNILNNAVNNYFEYVNPIIPLFTRSGFGSKPRSQILLLAIWVTGLSIDQHIPIIKEIRNFLLHRFTLELRKSYSHPTVDILQAYIISISWRLGYRGKPTNTSILCCIPIHLLHSLGLHQNPPNFLFSRHELIERRLLYSGLIFLDSNWASGNNTPCIVNMDHAETYGDEIKPHEIKFILRSSKSAEEAVYDITLISISKCNYIDCTILQAMRVLRHRIHVKTIESKELLEEVRGLQFKCRTLFLGFIRSMHDLKKVLLEYYKEVDKVSPLFERAILSLNMRFRIVFRDITALLLHLRPDLDGLPSRHTAECEGSPFIAEAVEAASQVAPIENEFGLMPYHASRPSHLGKTLIMLIKLKHLYRGPIDIKKQIDTILERMAILKTVHSWSSQVTFNLYLADKFNGQTTSGRAQL
ncbi:hypothetical protein K502DRAFT_324505 [Neoconidiobolus thromboides FSU 785]|nr:hypothetical protein K502DRAFT_324505 [Neoconidiobolus thromboides FSU 785]